MATSHIAAALRRFESVLRRRPHVGIDQDAPASARWEGDVRVVAAHPNGTQVRTDMPPEFGGAGDRVTPGWLLRAGLASCAATRIAMAAATNAIVLESLEVVAGSRSDARGLLGIGGKEGEPISAGPFDVQLRVRICAPGVPAERLRALVEESQRSSPVARAMEEAVPIALQIEIAGE